MHPMGDTVGGGMVWLVHRHEAVSFNVISLQLSSREITYLFKPLKTDVWMIFIAVAIVSSLAITFCNSLLESSRQNTTRRFTCKNFDPDWLFYGMAIWLVQCKYQ